MVHLILGLEKIFRGKNRFTSPLKNTFKQVKTVQRPSSTSAEARLELFWSKRKERERLQPATFPRPRHWHARNEDNIIIVIIVVTVIVVFLSWSSCSASSALSVLSMTTALHLCVTKIISAEDTYCLVLWGFCISFNARPWPYRLILFRRLQAPRQKQKKSKRGKTDSPSLGRFMASSGEAGHPPRPNPRQDVPGQDGKEE